MIFENILTKEQHENLVTFITSLDFPWYYQPNIAHLENPNPDNADSLMESFGLTHTVWDVEKGKVSEALSYVEPIVANYQKLTGEKINNFLRIKINLQTPIPNNSPEKYNGAHVDRYTDHKTMIYYPLESDGDTFIFNEIFNPIDQNTWPINVIPTIKERITPTANKLCVLDTGLRYHSSSNPISYSRRYSININFN